MKTSTIILYVLTAVVVIGGIGYFVTSSDSPTTTSTTRVTTETKLVPVAQNNELSETTTEPASAVTESQPTTAETTSIKDTLKTTRTAGLFTNYSAEAVANSEAEHIVLYFNATWCPSCRALSKDIENNLDNIPANTEIYKVDFDTALELRKKYKVTSQHTLIQIDRHGNFISKSVGDPTLSRVLSSL